VVPRSRAETPVIVESIKNSVPVLDPRLRACGGRGKPTYLVSLIGPRGNDAGELRAMEAAGGALRLCGACMSLARVQARGSGLSIKAVPIEASS